MIIECQIKYLKRTTLKWGNTTNDAIFVIYSCDLLPGDLRDQLNLPHRVLADKAALFLGSVIGQ